MLGHDWRFVKTPLKCNHWMEKHRQALPPSLLSGHTNDLSVRSNRGKWRMTEMQWSCKTTAFHIHIALPYSLYQAERVVLMECLPGPDCVYVCSYFQFCFAPPPPTIFAVGVCHPGSASRWSALSWQTFEVSQADTNMEHHPHITQNFHERGHNLIFFGPHYISAIFYWAPSNFVRGLLFLCGH